MIFARCTILAFVIDDATLACCYGIPSVRKKKGVWFQLGVINWWNWALAGVCCSKQCGLHLLQDRKLEVWDYGPAGGGLLSEVSSWLTWRKINEQLEGGSWSKIAALIMTGELIWRFWDAFLSTGKGPQTHGFSCVLPSCKRRAEDLLLIIFKLTWPFSVMEGFRPSSVSLLGP